VWYRDVFGHETRERRKETGSIIITHARGKKRKKAYKTMPVVGEEKENNLVPIKREGKKKRCCAGSSMIREP